MVEFTENYLGNLAEINRGISWALKQENAEEMPDTIPVLIRNITKWV